MSVSLWASRRTFGTKTKAGEKAGPSNLYKATPDEVLENLLDRIKDVQVFSIVTESENHEKSVTQMLEKPNVIESLMNNLHETTNRLATDHDLMFTYRDAQQAKSNPSLQQHGDSFLLQLYTDGAGITNPIGPKKNKHKLSFYYFLFEDLPDITRSMLQSIGLVGLCYTEYLSTKLNRTKFFAPIIEDLNALQTSGLSVKTFDGTLHFAFSTLSGDHLASNEIVIFYDIIEQLKTLELYIGLREIISHVYAMPFGQSWLEYFNFLTTRFQCLFVNMLPNKVIPKVHFVTDYGRLINLCGPPIRYWCMRFEAKHLYFKQITLRSFNFKNPSLTLAKRYQLRQCLLLLSANYHNFLDENYSTKIIEYTQYLECKTLIHKHVKFSKESVFIEKVIEQEDVPVFIRILFILKIRGNWKLVIEHLRTIWFNDKLWSYQIQYTQILSIIDPEQCLSVLPHAHDIYDVNEVPFVNILSCVTSEEADGETVLLLQENEILQIFPKLKDRVKFKSERQLLFGNTYATDRQSQQLQQLHLVSTEFEQPLHKNDNIPATGQILTIGFIDGEDFLSDNSVTVTTVETNENDQESDIGINNQTNINIQPLSSDFKILTIPRKVQQIIDNNDLIKLAGHTNHRRMLLEAVYNDLITSYGLLYPNQRDYTVITQAILIALIIPITNEAAMVYVNKIDDEEGVSMIQLMKDELHSDLPAIDTLKSVWKKTFAIRRIFIRNHTIQEVLLEYPAYTYP
ncbi:unnamed protein product [Didymodactylos carnosus]|uniref:Uncharacterized protein n=1 Tax=Didymodactylos carnosus TaxID=1234261 RepID=A0A814APC5_9BILA|nr:unnamed protein product [Didymodactylos carnosus]CAF3695914.1 unnamed protein product [Didymodactylos carnosus]